MENELPNPKTFNQLLRSDRLNIHHDQLSHLTLVHHMGSAIVLNVVAPQLKSLTIICCSRNCLQDYEHHKHLITAPNLMSLTYEGYDALPFPTASFYSLEKVDLCICCTDQEAEALEIVHLFQQIKTVKFLTLNLEILECLSSNIHVLLHPSPFDDLKSLHLYPKMVNALEITSTNIEEVINYLLGSTPGATFTMVSREEAVDDIKVTNARLQMAELKRYLQILDIEKDVFEANRDHMQQPIESGHKSIFDDDNGDPETILLQIGEAAKQLKSCAIDEKKVDEISYKILSKLKEIESVRKELPASKRAMLQPCFSSLHAESKFFVSNMIKRMNIRVAERFK